MKVSSQQIVRSEAQAAHIAWLDFAKGLAILLVVFGHCWRGVHNAGIDSGLFAAVDSRIYAFHMPLFFALSGYLYLSTLRRYGHLEYMMRLVRRILWPLVLWTYLFLFLKLLGGQLVNVPVGWRDLLILPIPGQDHLWFLWALFIISLVLVPLRFVEMQDKGDWRGFVLLAAVIVGFSNLPKSVALAHWTSGAFYLLPFFVLGIMLRRYGRLNQLQPIHGAVCAASFVVVLGFWPTAESVLGETLLAMVLTCLFIAATAAFRSGLGGSLSDMISRWGSMTLAIYLLHTAFSAATRIALLQMQITDWHLHVALGTVVGILGPVMVVRYFPSRPILRTLALR